MTERHDEEVRMAEAGRLPPGQALTRKFPILHYGRVPRVDLGTWKFRVFGEVEEEKTWSWEGFTALPTTSITTDIHCVTGWSKFDTTWEGPRFRDFAAQFAIKPEAKFIIAHAENDYTANLPLEIMYDDDVLLAWQYAGKPLEPDHGYPLRLVVPKRYFWKSAKWLTGLEFSAEDKPGFWEQAGYHNEGDPFLEQRAKNHPINRL